MADVALTASRALQLELMSTVSNYDLWFIGGYLAGKSLADIHTPNDAS